MIASPYPHEVRQLVTRTFQEFGATLQSAADVDETLLVDDGKYVARSYRLGGLLATWLVHVGLVQFYDAEGNMLRTVNLLERMQTVRLAA